ncbi:hypothetical protein MHYP_G00050880 [Metynnis hypsauchen]
MVYVFLSGVCRCWERIKFPHLTHDRVLKACCDQLRHSAPSLFSSKGSFFSSAQRLESLAAPVSPGLDFSWQSMAHAGVQWMLQEMGGTLEILACCSRSCIQVQKQPSFVVIMPAELSCPP